MICAVDTVLKVQQFDSNMHIRSNVGCMALGTYIDGPYLQARPSTDFSKCIWNVITHHSAELKQTHM